MTILESNGEISVFRGLATNSRHRDYDAKAEAGLISAFGTATSTTTAS